MTALGVGAAVGVRHAARRSSAGASCRTNRCSSSRSSRPACAIIAVASVVDARRPRSSSPRLIGAAAGLRVRHRLHDACRRRCRRAARPDVRDAVHDRASLPAALADGRAVRRERVRRDLRRVGRRRRRDRLARRSRCPGVRLALWFGGLVTVLSGVRGAPPHAPTRTRAESRKRDRREGCFIVLEGGEGSRQEHAGRSASCSGSRDAGRDVVLTHEPGDTRVGAEIRLLLLHARLAARRRAPSSC